MSSVIQAVEEFVKNHMGKYEDCSHDWLHIVRVRDLVRKLVEEERENGLEFDDEIYELAIMLHDVGDYKYVKETDFMKSEVGMLLEGLGLSSERIDGIIEIIKNVSFRHELEHGCSPDNIKYWNEFTVVQDADRLDSLGAIGLARCIAYSGKRNIPLYILDAKPELNMNAELYNKQTDKNGGAARFHFEEKLFKLKDYMKSAAGRKEAARRHQFMLKFVEQFDSECNIKF